MSAQGTPNRQRGEWYSHRLWASLLIGLIFVGPAHGVEPVRIADDVYAWIGSAGEISVANEGFTANSGFIIGQETVTVIDSGTTYRQGRQMLEAIRRVTPKPVGLLVLTHAIQEFIFGAAAFEELGVPILAHRKTAELMQARCEHCLKLLKPLLGDGLTGTRLVLPTQLIDRSTVLEQSGRSIELIYSGWASTPGDLAVLDRTSGVVFTGGIVTLARVPEIRDSDFDGWINALSKLKALKPNLVVPGYGAISRGTAGIEATEAYLRALDHKVRDLYSAGRGLLDAVENAALEPFAGLPLYDTLHRRNVLHRYLQLEIEDLGGDPRSTALPQ